MKPAQKLEIVFGAVTSIAALLCSYYFVIPELKEIAALYNSLVDWRGLYFFVAVALIIAVSACLHAVTRNGFALLFLLLSSGFFCFGYAVAFFLLGHQFKGYLGSEAAPGVLAAITLALAFYNQIRRELDEEKS